MADNATQDETKTITVNDAPALVAKVLPTAAEMKEKGWASNEIEMGIKQGKVLKEAPAPSKPAVKPAEPAKEPAAPPKAGAPAPELPKKNLAPDLTLSPEDEAKFKELFPAGTPQNGLYHRMKSERNARQRAETEAREIRAELKALKEMIKAPAPEVVKDENGVVINPDDAPLTVKRMKELEEEKARINAEKAAAQEERAGILVAAQVEQEEYAKAVYSDYEDTVTKAKDVMMNLSNLVPEKHKQTLVISLVRQFYAAAANADKLGLDDAHSAMLAYEIGKFHPQYGKAAPPAPGAETGKDPANPKGNGAYTPEQMKRIEENTKRRGASAALSGEGGSRTISVDEVDLKTLNGFNYTQRSAFKKNHPEAYARLVAG